MSSSLIRRQLVQDLYFVAFHLSHLQKTLNHFLTEEQPPMMSSRESEVRIMSVNIREVPYAIVGAIS